MNDLTTRLKQLVDPGKVADLLDNWVNSNPEPERFTRVVLSQTRNNDYNIKVWGVFAGTDELFLGETSVAVHQYYRGQSGFTATLDYDVTFDGLVHKGQVKLAANNKLGVLVIELFYRSACGAPPYICREFFVRKQLSEVNYHSDLVALPKINLSAFAGDWHNGNPEKAWLQQFQLAQQGTQWLYSVKVRDDFGAPIPAMVVTSYMDNLACDAFSAEVSLPRGRIVFSVNTQTALVVITSCIYAEGKPNQAYREVFVQY